MEEFFIKLGVSVLIGFVAGVERQMSSNYTNKEVGVRDLLIVSLLGFLASNVLPFQQASFFALFAFVAVLSLLGLWHYNARLAKSKVGGFTTFLTIPAVFVLSSLTGVGVPMWQIFVFLGVLILTLKMKDEWNWFITTIQDKEIVDFVLFLIVIFVITPLIPVDLSWSLGFYTLQAAFVWKIVSLISVLSFIAHFVSKYAKGKRAVFVTSFLGGFVSSLGIIYLVTKHSKKGTSAAFDTVYAVFVASSIGAMIRQILVVYYLVNAEVFKLMVLPFVASLFLLISVMLLSLKGVGQQSLKVTERAMPVKTIVRFVAIFFVVMFISALFTHYLPDTVLYLTAFVSSFMNSSSAIVASVDLFSQHLISMDVMAYSFVFAVVGSYVGRVFVVLKTFPKRFVKTLLPFALVIIGMGLGTYVSLSAM